MKFRITTKSNDRMSEAPPIEVEAHNLQAFVNFHLIDELVNDEGVPLGPGMTCTIERLI